MIYVDRNPKRWKATRAASCLLLLAGLAASAAVGARLPDPPAAATPAPRPDPAEAVTRLLAADYLNDTERKDLRIFHGQWTASDVDTPARLARACLMAGELDDPSLLSPDADPLDRAEAALLRGDLEMALQLTAVPNDPASAVRMPGRALRVRAEALADSGRIDESLAAGEALIDRVIRAKSSSPEDIVEGVRVLALRSRLKGPDGGGAGRAVGGADFHAMMGILAGVRDKLDRLYWPTYLVEAELLAEKDNPSEAQEALARVLELNPACARAWAMLGRMAVGAFDFDASDSIAARLDLLARSAGSGVAEDAEASAQGEHDTRPSPWGAFVRARSMLRLNDPERSGLEVEGVLARYPAQREALALRAAVAARRYDHSATAAALAGFDRLSPASPDALLEVGRTLSEARQYADAARYLALASERQPHWAQPLIELGLLQVQAGRNGEAGDALRTATRLDPFNVRAANTLKLVDELATYATVESDHFVVNYKPKGADGVLAREMLGPLEENFRTVTGNGDGGIEFVPPGKTVIDLMPDHRWFGVRIAGMPRIHTIAASTGPVIAMEAPRDGPGHLGTYDWVRVVRHEYTHTVTLARTNNRIPHWFTEASAVYLELAPREYSTCRMLAEALRNDELFDFTKINIAFVRPEKPSDRGQAYAQGHWMYEYIIHRWGREAPLKLMDRYAHGDREESAYQSVLGVSRETFMNDFKVWAASQVVEWGMEPRPGQPGVKELIKQEMAAKDAAPKEPAPPEADGADAGDAKPDGDEKKDDGPRITREMVAGWLEKYPDHPDVLQMAIDMDLRAADGEPSGDMVPLLLRYAAARPVDPMPHRVLAKYYLAGGDRPDGAPAPADAAIPHLEYLDAREQKSPTYAMALAKRYAAIGEWDKAQAKAERATRIAPYEAEERELAASVAIKRKDYDTAERHLAALTELEPQRAVHKERLEALKALRAR